MEEDEKKRKAYFNLVVEQGKIDRLRAMAKDNFGPSVSALIRQAISEFLAKEGY